MGDLPEWAEEWQPGTCACGARLCRPTCYCGGHVACSGSGTDAGLCPAAPAAPDLGTRDGEGTGQ